MNVHSRDSQGHQLNGDGAWVVNFAKNQGVEDYRFHDGPFPLFAFNLQRYDIGETFELNSRDRVRVECCAALNCAVLCDLSLSLIFLASIAARAQLPPVAFPPPAHPTVARVQRARGERAPAIGVGLPHQRHVRRQGHLPGNRH